MRRHDWSPSARGARLRVDVADVLADAKQGLSDVLRAVPGWQDGAAAEARVEQVSGAMTNLVYRCFAPASLATANAAVIVRVFGSGGKLFSQQDERNIFLLASQLGLGPRCLIEFENGRVEEFLPGDNLTCASFRQPQVSAAIAVAMAEFNVRMLANLPAAARQQVAGSNGGVAGVGSARAGAGGAEGSDGVQLALQAAIYERIRQWHDAAAELCGAELARLGLANLPQELAELEAQVAARFPPWVGFCHNDLQYGNMLLSGGSSIAIDADGSGNSTDTTAAATTEAAAAGPAPETPKPVAPLAAAAATAADLLPSAAHPAALQVLPTADGTDGSSGSGSIAVSVKLIDYEYSTLNDVAFDVANHFCEWAYNYHSDAAHVFHDAWLPSQEQQLHFCRAYVAAMQAQQAQHEAQQAHQPPASHSVLNAALHAAAAAAPQQPDSGAWLPAAILAAGGPCEERGAEDVLERTARLLLRKVQAHTPLVHLKWGLWGLIQDRLSDCDFDYLAYAKQRIQLYHATKRVLLEAVQ